MLTKKHLKQTSIVCLSESVHGRLFAVVVVVLLLLLLLLLLRRSSFVIVVAVTVVVSFAVVDNLVAVVVRNPLLFPLLL